MNYQPLEYATMFVAMFATVFLLGLQSRNVQASRYYAAIVVSFGISVCNFLFTKYVATGSMDAFVFCATGGCCGIAFSIWFYDNVMSMNKRGKEAPTRAPLSIGGTRPALHIVGGREIASGGNAAFARIVSECSENNVKMQRSR